MTFDDKIKEGALVEEVLADYFEIAGTDTVVFFVSEGDNAYKQPRACGMFSNVISVMEMDSDQP